MVSRSDRATAEHQPYEEEHDEDYEQDFRDPGRGPRDSPKTQDSGNYCYYEKYDSPIQHDHASLVLRLLPNRQQDPRLKGAATKLRFVPMGNEENYEFTHLGFNAVPRFHERRGLAAVRSAARGGYQIPKPTPGENPQGAMPMSICMSCCISRFSRAACSCS